MAELNLYYCAPDIEEGDSIHFSDLDHKIYNSPDPEWARTKPITVLGATSFSDYSGGSVEKSNYRVLVDDKEIGPHLVRLVGSHGSEALAYLGTPGDPPEWLRDTLAALDSYPLLSDDDHLSLEMDLESEAWADHGAHDFRRALCGVLASLLTEIDPEYVYDADDIDEDKLAGEIGKIYPDRTSADGTEEDALYTLWCDGCEILNVNGGSGYVVETGSIVYFYVDEWAEKALRDPHAGPEWARDREVAFRANVLLPLAAACAIIPSEDDTATEQEP